MALSETAVQKFVADAELTVTAVEKIMAEVEAFKSNPFNLAAIFTAVSQAEAVIADFKLDIADAKAL